MTSLLFKHVLAVKDGQDTTALKAEIAEKFGKLEEVRVFHDNEQIASLYIFPFFLSCCRLWR